VNVNGEYAASICSIEKYTLLTTPCQMKDYKDMDCCEVSELMTWVENQGAPTNPLP
jgi:hypothetical protein